MNFHRRSVPLQARSRTQTRPLPAPTLGWVSAQNQAAMKPGTALVLENWFPTQTGVRLFGGSSKFATVSEAGEPCESLMAYVGTTRKLLGASDGNIFNITSPVDEDAEETAAVTDQTSDYYSYVNYATAGGYFMYLVNGTDDPLLFTGTDYYPVNGEALTALDYDTETGTFAVGETLTGGTSGHTGVIEKVIDNGTDGTLWLRGATGIFQNNEAITDSGTGAAVADGTAATLIGAVTGATTSDLSHVNAYRNRLFFVEGGSLNVWALPVDVLAGALIQVSLAGVFKLGGSVLFTATWSLDAGDGLDDKLVVVSTEGEVAIYQGSDPSDSTDWSLVGLYEIPTPMGKNGYLKAGGDLVVLTTQGAIPISQAITRDKAALGLAAISKNIQPDWLEEATARSSIPWEIVKWPSRSMTLVTNPVVGDATPAQCFAVNSETGAWCKRTGWDARCFALHNDQVYFGTSDGMVMQADLGGNDNGANYVAKCTLAWDHLGQPGAYKTIISARAQFKTSAPVSPQISVSVDYNVEYPSPPNAGSEPDSSSQWDVGLWDVANWDEGATQMLVNTRWQSVGASGMVVAPQVQVTCGTTATPDAELVILEALYEQGEVMI